MTTLVIGSGLIGSQIARILVERGEKPVLMDTAAQPQAIGQIAPKTGIEPFAERKAALRRQIAAFVLTGGLRSPRLSEATRRYFDHQALRAVPTVRHAVDRGELPEKCDANALLTTFRAPLFYRMVTTGDPIDEALIAHAVRVALNAARAGLLSA